MQLLTPIYAKKYEDSGGRSACQPQPRVGFACTVCLRVCKTTAKPQISSQFVLRQLQKTAYVLSHEPHAVTQYCTTLPCSIEAKLKTRLTVGTLRTHTQSLGSVKQLAAVQLVDLQVYPLRHLTK